MRLVACVFSLLAVALLVENASSDAKSKRERLAPLGGLVGTWNATGVPAGSKEEQQKGFWTETINCEWQFKKDDAWLKLAFAKGTRIALHPHAHATVNTLNVNAHNAPCHAPQSGIANQKTP